MGVRYSTPKSATRQPDEQTSDESGSTSARYSCDSRLLNFSKINGKHNINTSTPVPFRKNSSTMQRSGSPNGNDSAIQSLAGSPLMSSRPNTYLDPMLYVNINSPGFVSRVVDSADQSAEFSGSGQSRYNGVGQFPRVQLGGPSPLPTLSSKNSQKFGKGTVHVRIAPPSSSNRYYRQSYNFSEPDDSFKSVLESLQEKSRKRIYSQCQETEDYNLKKKQRKGEGSFVEANQDGQQYRLNRSSSVGSPNAVLQIIDPVLQAKRAREEESPTESMKRQKKRVVTYNNEILSSLSSSRGLLQRLSASKRKTAEHDGSNTSALNKQFKENVDISSPQSPSRWVPQSKTLKENVVVPPKTTAQKSSESEVRPLTKDDEVFMRLLDEEEESSQVSKTTLKEGSHAFVKEANTPKISNKQEDVDMSSKLFRKNGTVKPKPRAAPASPWSHAAPAADELTCSLDKSRDKALERPQRFHGLLARMRGDGPGSTTSVPTVSASPSSASLSKPAVSSSNLLGLSTPSMKSSDKKPSATPFTITTPTSSAIPTFPSVVSTSSSTSSENSVSTSSTVMSSSATSPPTFGVTNTTSPKPGFGGFSRCSTVNTGSVSSSLFGSTHITSQASPMAFTSTTGSGARPLSSPTSSPKPATSGSSSAPATSATTNATSDLPTFGSTSTTAVVNSTSNATVNSSASVTPSSSSLAFGVPPATTSAAPTFSFGAVTSAPTTSSSTPAVTTAAPALAPAPAPAPAPAVSTSGVSQAAKPAAPTFQFGASNPAVAAAAGGKAASTPSTSAPTFSFGSNATPAAPHFGSAIGSTQAKSGGTPATSAAPTFGAGNTSAFGATQSSTPTFGASNAASPARPTPVFGNASSQPAAPATPAFGVATNGVLNFGSATPTPAPPSAPAPTFGATPAPVFGSTSSTSSTPAFGSTATPSAASSSAPSVSSAAPFFGSTTSAPTFGSAPTAATTPAFGAPAAPTATNTNAPSATNGVPTFGSPAVAPTFGAASTPAFGSNLATSSSTPAFGASVAATPAASNTTAPAFQFGGPSASQPTFNFSAGSSQSTPATSQGFNFSASPAPRAFQFNGSAASSTQVSTAAPTFGAGSAPTFGAAQSSAPSFGAPTSAFGAPQTGGFGNATPQPAPSTVPNFGLASATPAPTFGAPAAAPSAHAFGSASTSSVPNGNASAFQFGAPSTPSAPSATQAPAFNFNAGSSQSTPGASQGFNFNATPAAPAFQFNANGPASTPAPGMVFGSADGSANAVGLPFGSPVGLDLGVFPMGAGMFHIGTGSSNTSQRPRQTARRRK